MNTIDEMKTYILAQAELHKSDECDLFEIIEFDTLKELIRFSIGRGLRDDQNDVEYILNFHEDDCELQGGHENTFPADDSEKYDYLWNVFDEVISENNPAHISFPPEVKELFVLMYKAFWPDYQEE